MGKTCCIPCNRFKLRLLLTHRTDGSSGCSIVEKVQIEESGLVENHMRIAFSIPDDREYLRSGYPSEPLLAKAAATTTMAMEDAKSIRSGRQPHQYP